MKGDDSKSIPDILLKLDILRGLLLSGNRLSHDTNDDALADHLGISKFTISRYKSRPIPVRYLVKLADLFGKGLFNYELFLKPLEQFERELRELKYDNAHFTGTLVLGKLMPQNRKAGCSIALGRASGLSRGFGAAPAQGVIPEFRIGTSVNITVEGPAGFHFVLLESSADLVVALAPSIFIRQTRLPDSKSSTSSFVLPPLPVGPPQGRYLMFAVFTRTSLITWTTPTDGDQLVEIEPNKLGEFVERVRRAEYYATSTAYDIVA